MELKPCPFCGGKAFVNFRDDTTMAEKFVECGDCGKVAFGSLLEGDAEDIWNKRPTEEALEKQNAALREALENIMCVHNSNFGSYIKEVNFIAEQALKGESGE